MTEAVKKVIVFDFDGVFVRDSDAVYKPEAWGLVFGHYGERYVSLLARGNQLFGPGKPGGRIAIMQYVFEQLGEPPEKIPDLVRRAAQVFDEHVQSKILAAGLVAGAREMLNNLKSHVLSLYLNSSTATEALELSARNLQIAQFFKGILGSAKSKADNLRDIILRENVNPAEIVVVGDGDSDVEAAQAVGCRFVGISNRRNQWVNKPFPLITELAELPTFLAKQSL